MGDYQHTLTLLRADDWVAVFFDGEFLGEGHSDDNFYGPDEKIRSLTDILEQKLGVRVISHYPEDPNEEFFLVNDYSQQAEYARKLQEDADGREGAGEVSPV